MGCRKDVNSSTRKVQLLGSDNINSTGLHGAGPWHTCDVCWSYHFVGLHNIAGGIRSSNPSWCTELRVQRGYNTRRISNGPHHSETFNTARWNIHHESAHFFCYRPICIVSFSWEGVTGRGARWSRSCKMGAKSNQLVFPFQVKSNPAVSYYQRALHLLLLTTTRRLWPQIPWSPAPTTQFCWSCRQ